MASVDFPDWTQTVQLVSTGSSSSTPYVAGGAPEAVFTQSYDINSTGTFNLDPTDGKQHVLVAANLWITLAAGTITGTVIAQLSLIVEVGAFGLLNAQIITTTIPSTGATPNAQATMSWPGGVAITQRANTLPQLQALCSVQNFNGGSISGGVVQGYVSIAYA